MWYQILLIGVPVLLVFLFIYYKCGFWDIVIVLTVIFFGLILLYSLVFVDFVAWEYFKKYGLQDDFEKLNGYGVTPDDINRIGKVHLDTLTYGEIQAKGMEKIYAISTKHNLSIFVDMGCGVGKAVFLAKVVGFKRSIGVEVVESRIQKAQAFHKIMPANLKQGIELYRGNMYDIIDFKKYNEPVTVYASNLLWSKDMTVRLFEKVSTECKSGSLLFMSRHHDLKPPKNMIYIDSANIPMSWDKGSNMYIYRVI